MTEPALRGSPAGGRPGRSAWLAGLALIALVASGCASGTASPTPRATTSDPPAPSPSSSPSPNSDPGSPAVAPDIRVTWPAAGTARSTPATGDALTWTSSGATRTDVTIEVTSASSPNIDCAATSWQHGPTLPDRSSPIEVPDPVPGHCYRFIVTARSAAGAVATARSGTVWILPTWHGSIDLYRAGVFATQRTIDWCVPAAVEMVLNIVDGRSVSSYAEQAAFYRYGRAHLYTDYPTPGLDPTATTALLASQGQTYRDYRGGTLGAVEEEAVRQLRRTGKPVILYVDAGIHAWVLDGFAATADPATTDAFSITSFSVLGPLWPTQRYHDGYYDLPPDTTLSPGAFAAAVGRPFHEPTRKVPWEGWYVISEPL